MNGHESLSRQGATQRVRALAADSSNIYFTEHAQARMFEREISNRQVLTCLREGRVLQHPERDGEYTWILTMTRGALNVVAALDWQEDPDEYVLVITVIV